MHRIEPEPQHLPATPIAPSPSNHSPSTAEPSTTPGPRSRAALNLPGLCPVCGDPAQRRITTTPQETRETYRCRDDGETVYLNTPHGRWIQLPGESRAQRIERLLPERKSVGLQADLGNMVPMIQAAV